MCLFLDMINNIVRPLLDEIFYLGSRSPILAFKKIGKLLQQYNTSNKHDKIAILEHIAKVYHPDENKVLPQVGYSILNKSNDFVEFYYNRFKK